MFCQSKVASPVGKWAAVDFLQIQPPARLHTTPSAVGQGNQVTTPESGHWKDA